LLDFKSTSIENTIWSNVSLKEVDYSYYHCIE